ncbi:MAG: hypothetical protein SGJ19_20160 [Planctomycetia bacterium]|nr:hypothetical protein [Planctomycetia bacterium]
MSILMIGIMLTAAAAPPAAADSSHDWRRVGVGACDYSEISLAELTAQLSLRSDVPIHLVCEKAVYPVLRNFKLSEAATLGSAFELISKSIPGIRASDTTHGVLWVGPTPVVCARPLQRKVSAIKFVGTFAELVEKTLAGDYTGFGTGTFAGLRTDARVLQVRLDDGNKTALELLASAAEGAEGRLFICFSMAEKADTGSLQVILQYQIGDMQGVLKRQEGRRLLGHPR